MRVVRYAVPFILGAAFVTLFVIGLLSGPSAQAGPPLAPTPVANLNNSDKKLDVTFYSSQYLTLTEQTGGKNLAEYNWIDVQTTVDQADGNLITITVQFSNDNSNWDDGPVLIDAGTTADSTDVTRIPLFGKYMRLSSVINPEDTDPLTMTVLGLAKR